MPNDKFGIKMLYPNATDTSKNWFIKDGFEDDSRVRLDEGVKGNGTDGYRLDDNSKVRFSVAAIKDTDIGCKNDFSASEKRGYVYKSTDWKQVEQTCYFKLSYAKPTDNSIIMKGPTGEHHSNTDCCSGSAYQVRLMHGSTMPTEFAKEMWHVNYTTKGNKSSGLSGFSIEDNVWFGAKFIHFISQDGKTVKLECWINQNADKQTWKKVNSITDGGNWGSKGDDCNGDNDQILLFGNARMMLRWDFRDGSDIKFKWYSIREINPFGTFDDKPDDPVNPPTNIPDIVNFRSTLKIQRDMNYNFSNCLLTGEQEFWGFTFDADDELQLTRDFCNCVTDDFRTRIGQKATSGSGLLGHIPKRVEFVLRKNGTPSGNVDARIYDVNGVLKYTSPAITANSLPTEFYADENSPPNVTSFDFDTNTRTIVAGDRIVVNYTGTDSNNNISLWLREPGDFSSGTHYTYYSADTGTWGDGFTDRDCYFIAYEDIA